jgi:diadenosine tetraphosphate (Ap4A) HIT family hydrolase
LWLALDFYISNIFNPAQTLKVIKKAINGDRMNYAILGNTEPHLHFHLIPRKIDNEPIPNRSPWNHPDPLSQLPSNERIFIMKAISDALLSN